MNTDNKQSTSLERLEVKQSLAKQIQSDVKSLGFLPFKLGAAIITGAALLAGAAVLARLGQANNNFEELNEGEIDGGEEEAAEPLVNDGDGDGNDNGNGNGGGGGDDLDVQLTVVVLVMIFIVVVLILIMIRLLKSG
ncbi:uncharacterized protein LOC126666040 [Mercurialis annua]|uniref:uncharacterized protein LOC126666040 n=1 Tax=Mercurialis annua TaxID=3986 RepID=UPI00215FB946|nr:uncharacterized protein LOC126666040 [Mercurialis annua]